ncbi:acyl-CoA dehydrogenase family protein, partial [Streptomyces sp. NPDC055078]
MAEQAVPPLKEYLEEAAAWLRAHARPRPPRSDLRWGEGTDSVSLFRGTSLEEERAQLDAVRAWQREKSDAGYGSISWPVAYGGAGLPPAHESGFRALERGFDIPQITDLVSISLQIEAPTILALGSEQQKQRWIASLRRCDELCCQLFSEPGAGSDLGSISLRAERDGEEWVLNGQKVWTSGAQFADVGYVICRTDSRARRQEAFTAFLVPLDTPGVTVRPLRQMTGGVNFNEVFFDDVRVGDADRLGALGSGWSAMMTSLGF